MCNEVSLHTGRNGHYQMSANNECWMWCREKGTFLHCWWECKLVQLLWRKCGGSLKNWKCVWSSNSIPGHISREKHKLKNICTWVFIAALFTVAKIWNQHKYPLTEEWGKNIWGIYIHLCVCINVCIPPHTYTMEYYSNIWGIYIHICVYINVCIPTHTHTQWNITLT